MTTKTQSELVERMKRVSLGAGSKEFEAVAADILKGLALGELTAKEAKAVQRVGDARLREHTKELKAEETALKIELRAKVESRRREIGKQ